MEKQLVCLFFPPTNLAAYYVLSDLRPISDICESKWQKFGPKSSVKLSSKNQSYESEISDHAFNALTEKITGLTFFKFPIGVLAVKDIK